MPGEGVEPSRPPRGTPDFKYSQALSRAETNREKCLFRSSFSLFTRTRISAYLGGTCCPIVAPYSNGFSGGGYGRRCGA